MKRKKQNEIHLTLSEDMAKEYEFISLWHGFLFYVVGVTADFMLDFTWWCSTGRELPGYFHE